MKSSGPAPIITLTTDFGLEDHYVGTMKGVLLSRCPSAQIIDISHQISPFSICAGAYAISQAAPFFPEGTVHVIVVDPGVGTARRAILVEVEKQYFVAPDNGVLSLIWPQHGSRAKIWEITNRRLWRDPPSDTFHGRDIFAPVAAAVAGESIEPDEVGPEIEQIIMLPDLEPSEVEAGVWRGRVLSVDHFGNVITNFRLFDFPQISRGEFHLDARGREITEFRMTFGEAKSGDLFAYFGSSGYVEIGLNQSNAAERLGLAAGDAVTLRVTID